MGTCRVFAKPPVYVNLTSQTRHNPSRAHRGLRLNSDAKGHTQTRQGAHAHPSGELKLIWEGQHPLEYTRVYTKVFVTVFTKAFARILTREFRALTRALATAFARVFIRK